MVGGWWWWWWVVGGWWLWWVMVIDCVLLYVTNTLRHVGIPLRVAFRSIEAPASRSTPSRCGRFPRAGHAIYSCKHVCLTKHSHTHIWKWKINEHHNWPAHAGPVGKQPGARRSRIASSSLPPRRFSVASPSRRGQQGALQNLPSTVCGLPFGDDVLIRS